MSGRKLHDTDTATAERARALADALAASLDGLFDHVESARRIPDRDLRRLNDIVAGWNDAVTRPDASTARV
ncbi:MAG: hypothetical protein WAX14_15380 [Rhodococcus sp. (in: high G+C Gram-positive bacteria)]|uniref:hypothetical protein n=1 Tax=Rhodococcus sp. TaxID=1831 RepID=UPI003BB7DF4E